MSIMFRILDERFDNATFIMAGMACLIPVLGGYGLKGVGYLSPICPPLIGLWLGLLLRDITGQPRKWFLILVASVVAGLADWLLEYGTINSPTHMSLRLTLYTLLGYLVPFRDVFRGDFWGLKVALLVLSLVAIATLRSGLHVSPRRVLLLILALRALIFLSVFFVTEFAFSQVGQWLGSRNWFRIVAAVLMLLVFVGRVVDIIESGFDWRKLLVLAAQPVTIIAVLVLVRTAFKNQTEGPVAPGSTSKAPTDNRP